MWTQFFFENAHFAIHLATAGVMFSVFWLYADAWRARKSPRELFKVIGYLLLGCSYLVSATIIESNLLTTSLFGSIPSREIAQIIQIVGYICLIGSLIKEPLQDRPTHAAVAILIPTTSLIPSLLPMLAIITSFLYIRRATVGLEHHIKPIGISFFLISLSDLLSLPLSMTRVNTIGMYQLVAPFGPLWTIKHILLLGATIVLAHWVFSYLLTRFQTQLFIFFSAAVLIIFLITTITFTSLLLSSIQKQALQTLETDVRVLSYALESKKSQLIADATSLAQNPQLIDLMNNPAKKPLSDLLESQLLAKKQSSLVITNASGIVLARGEDRDRRGDSVASKPLIQRALTGIATASAAREDEAIGSHIVIEAAVPIKIEASTAGTILIAAMVDNAFVDGIEKTTGLSASVFSGDTISATTLMDQDRISRLVGIKEHQSSIVSSVLKQGTTYSGSTSLGTHRYLGAYLPIFDSDHAPIGMMLVGVKEATILTATGQSIELTFIVTAILIILAIIPSYLISRSIASQVS